MDEFINRQELSDSLKRKLKELGLRNLRDAAALLGISASTLSRILNCKFDPDTKTLNKLRNSPLDISIDSILRPSPQLALDYRPPRYPLPAKEGIEVHLRGNKKKLEAHPNEAKETLVRTIRLAYEDFLGNKARMP